ncbi:MAG TPA: hypothetical protein VIC59_08330 [Gemmatimonadota bacterium]|jgi:hypothetical protein
MGVRRLCWLVPAALGAQRTLHVSIGGFDANSGSAEQLVDIAPTLLDLGGYDVAPSMLGKPLASGVAQAPPTSSDLPADEGKIVRERLRGLGYIS